MVVSRKHVIVAIFILFLATFVAEYQGIQRENESLRPSVHMLKVVEFVETIFHKAGELGGWISNFIPDINLETVIKACKNLAESTARVAFSGLYVVRGYAQKVEEYEYPDVVICGSLIWVFVTAFLLKYLDVKSIIEVNKESIHPATLLKKFSKKTTKGVISVACVVFLIIFMAEYYGVAAEHTRMQPSTYINGTANNLEKVFNKVGRFGAYVSAFLTAIDFKVLMKTIESLTGVGLRGISSPYQFLRGYVEKMSARSQPVLVVFGSLIIIGIALYGLSVYFKKNIFLVIAVLLEKVNVSKYQKVIGIVLMLAAPEFIYFFHGYHQGLLWGLGYVLSLCTTICGFGMLFTTTKKSIEDEETTTMENVECMAPGNEGTTPNNPRKRTFTRSRRKHSSENIDGIMSDDE